MKSDSGFTLIEVMTSVAISTLLAGLIYTLFQMSGSQLRAGTATLAMTRVAEAVSEEIAKSGFEAKFVKTTGDPADRVAPLDTAMVAPMTGLTTVVFVSASGDSLGGYSIQGNRLQELTGPMLGRYWADMAFGSDTVRLDAANSSFEIIAQRRGVKFRLRYKNALGDTLSPVTEAVLCRNAYR